MNKVYTAIWVIMVVVAVLSGWYFYVLSNSARLDIMIVPAEKISVGIPFTVMIGVSNLGVNILNEVKVSFSLPEGMIFLGAPSSKTSDTKNIGSIGSGSIIETNFDVIILGGASATSTKAVQATVSYLPKGVSSRFEKNTEGELTATTNGLSLDFIMPEKVSPGEDFSFVIKYKNISDIGLKNLKLSLDYPPGFEFKKATLMPDISKNIWDLGDLRKGSEMEFKIIGNILGGEGSFGKFIARISSSAFGDDYVIAESDAETITEASLLELKTTLNDSDSVLAVGVGEDLHYKIYYINKIEKGLEDAILSAQLMGDMFDFSTLRTNGIISPSGSSIVWNKITNKELGAIGIGGSGAVIFDIKTKNNYPIKRLSDKNFMLRINSRIESGIAGDSKNVVGADKMETKVRGNVAVATKVYFRDAETGILNKGSVPPKVGMPTNYTVHWIVTNYATDISDINLQAVLGSGVRYTGVSKTTTNTDLVYTNISNAVSWHIDKISATRGLVDKSMELIFQIEATPSVSQLGSVLPLMGATILTAKDDFTGLDLTASGVGINSASKGDPFIGANEGIVIP